MTKSKRQTLGAISLLLGLAVLMLILMLSCVHAVGTDDALYYALQTEAGVLPGAGISDAGLRGLDAALAGYLAGRPYELVMEPEDDSGERKLLALEVNGVMQPAFNSREMAHLQDCYDLFALLRKVRRRLLAWVVLLVVGGIYLLQDRRAIRRVALLSPLVLLVPLWAFAAWAIADFDGAFTFFHRLLFNNDLWLLDPRTDLLIRICPQSMFEGMGIRLAIMAHACAIGVALLTVAATWTRSKSKKRSGEEKWNDNRSMRRAVAQRRKTFDFGEKR